MGRFKKDEPVTAEQIQPATPTPAPEVTPNLTNTALGTFQGTQGMWFVAKIRYNPQTGEVGKVETIGHGDDKISVNERFKITVVNEKIL